jgi:hypothetical protein
MSEKNPREPPPPIDRLLELACSEDERRHYQMSYDAYGPNRDRWAARQVRILERESQRADVEHEPDDVEQMTILSDKPSS